MRPLVEESDRKRLKLHIQDGIVDVRIQKLNVLQGWVHPLANGFEVEVLKSLPDEDIGRRAPPALHFEALHPQRHRCRAVSGASPRQEHLRVFKRKTHLRPKRDPREPINTSRMRTPGCRRGAAQQVPAESNDERSQPCDRALLPDTRESVRVKVLAIGVNEAVLLNRRVVLRRGIR